MLIEELNKTTEIFDKEGLVFLIQKLRDGFTSMKSLKDAMGYSAKKKNIDLAAAMLLFQSMEFIDVNGNKITKKPKLNAILTEDSQIVNAFKNKYIDFVIHEDILRFRSMSYNDTTDEYLIPCNSIRIKHSCYRNLLLSLGVLAISGSQFYSVSEELKTKLETKEIRRKITQEQLLSQLEKQQEQGEEGELFVLNFEKKRLINHPKIDRVKRISPFDVSAGYDIVSFMDDDSTSIDRYIEVKTYIGNVHFHWSQNEMDKAKIYREHYFVYLVDYDAISEKSYCPIIIQDPIEFFKITPGWIIEPDSFFIKKANDI